MATVSGSSGEVLWVPAASLEVPCNMSLTTWPNDKHDCVFIFGKLSVFYASIVCKKV